jgi:hypothetical protein
LAAVSRAVEQGAEKDIFGWGLGKRAGKESAKVTEDATKNGNQQIEGVASPRSAQSTLNDVVLKRHPANA